MAGTLAIGLDLGGTQVRAAVVDGARVLRRAAARTDVVGGPASVMEQFAALVREVMDGEDLRSVAGIGIAAAGPLDTGTGVVLGIPTIPGWEGFALRQAIADRFGLPVVLENDAIAAAYGEWRHGAGRGLRHMVYVTVSTGIGGGAVVDGHLLRGRRGMAGHVGHLRLAPDDGPVCACGARGCFEALASGTALGIRAKAARMKGPSGYLGGISGIEACHVFEGARAGDPQCLELVADEARLLGRGFTSIIHLFSPDRIVMGGGVAEGFDLLSDGIHAVIRAEAVAPFRDVPVVRAELGGNAGIVGAAALVMDAVATAA